MINLILVFNFILMPFFSFMMFYNLINILKPNYINKKKIVYTSIYFALIMWSFSSAILLGK